jgi:hypothetical protein
MLHSKNFSAINCCAAFVLLATACADAQSQAGTDAGTVISVGIVIVISILMYFLPAIIASKKKKRNATAIGVLNLLLGWTVVGWIVSLIWALTNDLPQAEAAKAGR